MIKVIKFKKLKSGNKKYEITFEKNGKKYIRKFGAAGMSDFTIHRDLERRERYISRHKKDLRTNDPMKPGYLSMYILWNKPSLKASLADYKRRLNVYNKTGKFPTSISGSKKLSFGTKIPFDETSLKILPGDIKQLIQEDVSASNIQKIQRGKTVRKNPENTMTKKFLKDMLWKMNADYESPEYATEQMTSKYGQPWLVLNIFDRKTTRWFFYAADILTAKDFTKDSLWYNCLKHILQEYNESYSDINEYDGQTMANLNALEDNIELLLDKLGYMAGFQFKKALKWLKEEYPDTNSFGKIPDNVVNKKLYNSIKTKIKKTIKGRRWGAYDSGRLVREYKAAGGKYTGNKRKTNLGRWYKEKWVNACSWPKRKPCGRKTKESIAYCRPSVKVDSKTPKLVQKLTKTQIKRLCSKKKKNPMKIITRFGSNEKTINKIRQQMFNEIIKYPDINEGIKNSIDKRCKGDFNDNFCQNIFTELLLSIYYTIVKRSKISKLREQNILEMKNYIPKYFVPTLLEIKKYQFEKIETLLYALQDHSYGTFKNARVASLIYEYIKNK